MTTQVRRRMGVEERRRQLIAVALDLFGRRAPEDVSIDEIAATAGISRPLVYHYFPGRPGLYEAALEQAARDLAERFVEPRQGPVGERLIRVVGRFFDFLDAHGRGLASLVRATPATGSPGAGFLADSVRQAAYEQILLHLGTTRPPARLELVVRSWISLAESTALLWLDGLGAPEPSPGGRAERAGIPRHELERQLVHDFGALLAVSAAYDERMARLLRRILAEEPPDGPFGQLAGRLTALVPAPPGAMPCAAGPG